MKRKTQVRHLKSKGIEVSLTRGVEGSTSKSPLHQQLLDCPELPVLFWTIKKLTYKFCLSHSCLLFRYWKPTSQIFLSLKLHFWSENFPSADNIKRYKKSKSFQKRKILQKHNYFLKGFLPSLVWWNITRIPIELLPNISYRQKKKTKTEI